MIFICGCLSVVTFAMLGNVMIIIYEQLWVFFFKISDLAQVRWQTIVCVECRNIVIVPALINMTCIIFLTLATKKRQTIRIIRKRKCQKACCH